MRIITLPEIAPILEDRPAIIAAVKQAFIDHGQGRVTLPEPVQLLFEGSDQALAGDCHIKTASSKSLPYFCVKIATGFYDNPSRGLPVNNGLVLLMSAKTGAPLVMFQDEGHLTLARTAAAGAIAASLKGGSQRLGIIGTGAQAALQSRWITAHMDIDHVNIWGRNTAKAETLKQNLQDIAPPVAVMKSVADLCAHSDIIVTTTPSTQPILMAEHIRAGHHIIAVGADSPGKIELDPKILDMANIIITDDHEQCLHHGEFGHGVRTGYVAETADINFGQALSDGIVLDDDIISVVDLTGLGAQDLAIASAVFEKLSA